MEDGRSPLARAIVAIATVAAVVLLFALVPALRHAVTLALHGDLNGLRRQIRGLGTGGVLLLFVLMIAHAVIFYPSEIITATAGFGYSFLPGLALSAAGWLISALLSYLLGRTLGRPLLYAIFGARRFASLERAVERGGTPLLLASRFIPIVPFSLMGYVAGAVKVNVYRFAWTTVVGYLPLTIAVAYFGSRAQSISLSSPLLWGLVLLFVVLLAAARFVDIGRPTAAEEGASGD